MKEIPNWILNILKEEELTCSKCDKIFEVDNLISIGIQESSQAPHHDTLCIGIFCHRCKELTIFELKEMSLLEFAFEILGRETENDKAHMPKVRKKKRRSIPSSLRNSQGSGPQRRKRSKITLKEMNKDVSFLKSLNTHEEFLLALGMSLEEIDKYNIKK
ncbi:MAG: hypothetical protein ACTSSP_03350 [Candidatus Asgardarchaeia archaeon]